MNETLVSSSLTQPWMDDTLIPSALIEQVDGRNPKSIVSNRALVGRNPNSIIALVESFGDGGQ
jgi:hypothetical protein